MGADRLICNNAKPSQIEPVDSIAWTCVAGAGRGKISGKGRLGVDAQEIVARCDRASGGREFLGERFAGRAWREGPSRSEGRPGLA